MDEAGKPSIRITYCTQCHWLLRAAWMAQELLRDLRDRAWRGNARAGHRRRLRRCLDGETVWDRKRDGGFPDAAALKQRVRDVVDPGRSLGHADRKKD